MQLKAKNMKNLIYNVLIITVLLASSCKKDIAKNPEPLLASLNVINAATDDYAAYFNGYTSGMVYARQNLQNSPIYLGKSFIYGIPSGISQLKIVSASDTLKTFYNNNIDLKPLKMYSLFVAGTSSKRENILIEDTVLPRYADSAIAVRVINLSIDGPKINVVKSRTDQFSNIAYKAISDFKKFSLNTEEGANGLNFDIEDAVTGNILTTYSLSQFGYPISTASARFKAITLVICGSVNAQPFDQDKYQAFAIANY